MLGQRNNLVTKSKSGSGQKGLCLPDSGGEENVYIYRP